MSSRRRRAILVLAAVVVGWACSDAPTTPSELDRGLTIYAEQVLTDTVTAPPALVTVSVRDDEDRPVAGALVTFTRRNMEPRGEVFSLAPTWSDFPAGGALDTTDSDGSAAVRLWRGIRPGTGYLHVQVRFPSDTAVVALQDSVLLRTNPGLPAGFAVTPRDTSLYQGGSAAIIAGPVDRFENPLPGTARLEAATTGITLDGNILHATAGPSRQSVRVTYDAIVDSAMISIMPRGVIAVRNTRQTAPDSGYVFATLELDGSDYSLLLPNGEQSASSASGPQWGHGGGYLLFSGGSPLSLYKMTTDGVVASVPVEPLVKYNYRPKETLDGSWLFFEGATADLLERYIYRARPDGSEVSRLSPEPPAPEQYDWFPSPSPDGSLVVYSTNQELDQWGNATLQVLDIASGMARSLGVGGTTPSWSPTGELIAFSDGSRIFLIHPDGTGLRQISADGEPYEPGISWSPDGKWLVTEHYGPYIEVIEVATGLRLPMMFTGYLRSPSWRPD